MELGGCGWSDSDAIRIENVTKSYSEGSPVLRNICMRVETGSVYGFLGSSGCGKTTLLACVLGLTPWESGEIRVLGRKIKSGQFSQNKLIGYMPQDFALQLRLTPKEIITCYGYIHGMSRVAIERKYSELAELLGITSLESQYISSLSGGEKRRVSLAISLIHTPELVILDEPTVGLDPLLRVRIWKHLYALTSTGRLTILCTTHYVEELRRCHTVGVMRNGRLIEQDHPDKINSKYQCDFLQDSVLKACRLDQKLSAPPHVALSILVNPSIKVEKSSRIFISPWRNKDPVLQEVCKSVAPISYRKVTDPPAPFDTTSNRTTSSSCGMVDSARRAAAYTWFMGLEILRDVPCMVVIILLPVLLILPALLVVGKEPKNLPLGIVSSDENDLVTDCNSTMLFNTSANCLLLHHLSESGILNPIPYATRQEAENETVSTNLWGFLEIPSGYSQHLEDRGMLQRFADSESIDGSTVNVRLENSNYIVDRMIRITVYKSLFRFFEHLAQLKGFESTLMQIPMREGHPVYGNPNTTVGEYAAPSCAIMCGLTVSFCITPYLLMSARNLGVIDRLRVAGLGYSETTLGFALALLPFTILNSLVGYICLAYVLGFQMCSVPVFVLLLTICSLVGTSLGILSTVLIADLLACLIFPTIIIMILSIYLGGTNTQECFPPVLLCILPFLPVVSLCESLRSMMNREVSLGHSHVWPGIVGGLAWILLAYLCSIPLKRRLYNNK